MNPIQKIKGTILATLLLSVSAFAQIPVTPPGGGGGGGSVTTVSVTTANGVSGTVANATTTPAISLTLGAITPTSIDNATIGTTTPSTVKGTTVTATTQVVAPAGNNTTPGFGFSSHTQLGFVDAGGSIGITTGGAYANLIAGTIFRYRSTQSLGFTSGDPTLTTADTVLSRTAAGVMSLGTSETVNGKGTLDLGLLQGTSAIPSVANGTGTVAIVTGSTNVAGTLTSSTTGSVSFTLTWGDTKAYVHRGVCQFTDETTPADTIQTSAANTTTLTAGGITVTGDTISYSCTGY